VKSVKDQLISLMANIDLGVGSVINVPFAAIQSWNNDNATIEPYANYSFIKISGGYSGSRHGQWLVSAFGD
jgi:hypothetical protein